MKQPQSQMPRQRGRRGFQRASGLVESQIRNVGEGRGFAVARLLTHWEEIVGPDIARIARPVKVGYAQGGFGATLTLLSAGAHAPMLQAQLPQIRERVNACYGYSAISRVRITQTSAAGFAEAQTGFSYDAPGRVRPAEPALPSPEIRAEAETAASGVTDPELRAALQSLGSKILDRSR